MTKFLCSTFLSDVQAQVNKLESEGWTFVSLQHSIAGSQHGIAAERFIAVMQKCEKPAPFRSAHEAV